ncbi:MAG TPA: amidohydrolase family protein [Vicinamibacterales bacterium]|jgi:gamma-resorcylate decarboxylase
MTYELPAIGKPPDGPPLEKIVVEEHFDALGTGAQRVDAASADLQSLVKTMDYNAGWMTSVNQRLRDFGNHRLTGMDASGISVSILSHTVPGVQGIADPNAATTAAREINDRLALEISRQPTRYAGFASIALQDPASAPLELERAVTRLGLKGAMINGYTNTRDPQRVEYLDDPKFLPFWEAAAALGVPIYLHPRPALDQRIYEGHSELIGATWGFAPEAATHALRLIYSGLFDRFPMLTVILGHLGETLPYFSWRIQHCFEYNPSNKRVQRRLQDYLCDNFYVSTSGIFSDQALIGAMLTIGADRILFACDYPYEVMEPAARWIERAAISEGDRRKIAAGNARRLFKIP